MTASKTSKPKRDQPTIENRKARHAYHIHETLECGMKLTGSEVKSLRAGQASLGEGYVRAEENPPRLTLHGVHIAEYPPAGAARQHDPIRTRVLLASKREIRKLCHLTVPKGTTLIPLKLYFVRGVAKLLIGVATGKRRADKRHDLAEREARRDIDRAMTRARR
jgi:SsrA-binding protein